MTLKERLPGKFIVFDGPDGSGKGTQIRMLSEMLAAEGLDVVLAKDPGGTAIGDRIRQILLGGDLAAMDLRCETFLFMASRAQLVGEVVEPALNAGKVVLCDRFISSTCAYQGAAGYDVLRIIELGRYAVGTTWPHLTLILNVPAEEGFERTGRRPHHANRNHRRKEADQGMLFQDARPDAMEARSISYHRKVREMFLSLPKEYPGCVKVVNGCGTQQEVNKRVVDVLQTAAF